MLPIKAKLLELVGRAAAWAIARTTARAKVVKAERDAYAGKPLDMQPSRRRSFTETYERLLGVSAGNSTVGNAVAAFEQRLSVPTFLRGMSTRDWLTQESIKQALFLLADLRLSDKPVDASSLSELRQSYAKFTGEAGQLADGPINGVIDALVAGYHARLDEQTSYTVDAIGTEVRSATRDIRADISVVSDRLQSVAQGVTATVSVPLEKLATAELTRQLDSILLSRAFDPQTPSKIRLLISQIEGGTLTGASHEQKKRLYIWAARILAGNPKTIREAKEYFGRLVSSSTESEYVVTRALIDAYEGRPEDALRVLRELSTPDGRAAFLIVLNKSNGPQAVVDWYEQHNPRLDYRDITPMGWITLAGIYSTVKRWEEAIRVLEGARALSPEFPDLLFIEGMYRACMLFPPELRDSTVNGNLIFGMGSLSEGQAADDWRASAIDLLALARAALSEISPERSNYADRCRLWLSLGSRREPIRLAAEEEVKKALLDKSSAVKIYPIATQFNFQIDTAALERYLEARKVLGGLTDDEWLARLFIALESNNPADTLAFLDASYSELEAVVDARFLLSVRIKLLCKSEGQASRARQLLQEKAALLDPQEVARLEVEVSAVEGEDVRPRLEQLYRENPNLVNLRSLIDYLAKVSDLTGLQPYARELYAREPSTANARFVVASLQSNRRRNAKAIVEFLQGAADVIQESKDLQSELAWNLLELGHWRTAKDINDKLVVDEPLRPDFIGLEINIAIKTGDWDHLGVVFERVWPERENLDASTLLLLAKFADDGHASREKAMELVKLAATNAGGSPSVLAASYQAAVNLGKEDEVTASWLMNAAAIDVDGVVKRATLREIVEDLLPSMQERSRNLMEWFDKSTAPIQVVAGMMNLPLARIYCGIPCANEAQPDARKRAALPVFGAHVKRPVPPHFSNVGLDISSVLLLASLGKLETAISSFGITYIAPETFQILLNEKRRIRFQQPSEVRLAEELIRVLRRSTLQPASEDVRPPLWLINEVGGELAGLIEKARGSGGYLVAAHPLLRTSSLGEHLADLREYAAYVVSGSTFVDLLEKSGILPHAVAAKANLTLARHESGINFDTDFGVNSPPTQFYIDSVSVRTLHHCGVLDSVGTTQLKLYCAPTLPLELEQTLAEARERERTVEIIDAARRTLRSGLEAAHIRILPVRAPEDEREALQEIGAAASFPAMTFLYVEDEIKSLVIDDRFFARLQRVETVSGTQIEVFSTKDVIEALSRLNQINLSEGQHLRHRIRTMGLAYLEPDSDELLQLLMNCPSNAAGLLESAELKSVRQSLITGAMLKTGDVRDRQYLDAVYRTLKDVILKLWMLSSFEDDKVRRITRWLLDNVLRTLVVGVCEGHAEGQENVATSFLGMLLSELLITATGWESEQRRRAFHEVLDEEILGPAERANVDVLEKTAEVAAQYFVDIQTRHGAGVDIQLAMAISKFPECIHARLTHHLSLGELARMSMRELIKIGDSAPILVGELFEGALQAARTGAFERKEQPEYRLQRIDGSISLTVRVGDSWETRDVPELGALVEDSGERVANVKKLVEQLGPTFTAAQHVLDEASLHALVEVDFAALIKERTQGVQARWSRIYLGHDRSPIADVVGPRDLNYYVALVGAPPTSFEVKEYFDNELLPHWRALLRGDFSRALRIALFGFLHISLAPSQLVSEVNNDNLWTAIEQIGTPRDPYSVLGLAEIGLRRREDPRFADLATSCIRKLIAEVEQDVSMFGVAAEFARHSLSAIQRMDGARFFKPYWKRIAAWVHAGAVIENYSMDFRFNVESLAHWVDANLQPTNGFCELLDGQEEPLVAGGWMTAEACHDNVLRLLNSVAQEETGPQIPASVHDELAAAIERRAQRSMVSFLATSPCLTLAERGKGELSQGDKEVVQAELEKNCMSRVWHFVALIAQLLPVEKEIYAIGTSGLRLYEVDSGNPDVLNTLESLSDIAVVSAACGDIELATIVCDILVKSAAFATTEDEVYRLLSAQMIAAAAFTDAQERSEWQASTARRICSVFQAGPPARFASDFLQGLSQVDKWKTGPATWAELDARLGY